MRLAASNIAAGVVTWLYSVPAGRRAVLNLNLCNRATATAKVRVAITAGQPPVDADWIEYETPLPAAGSPGGSVLERTGLALGAGQQVHVRADVAGISAVLYGIEDVA